MSATLLLIRRSLRQHLFSSIITILSVALAAGLVMSVFAINKQTRTAFTGGPIGFDAVLGARGSQLQLVLNSVFHLETSPGNIPWSLYQTIKKDRNVKLAIPYAVGDNYKGMRIVGTNSDLFEKFEYQAGKKFKAQPQGRFFDESRREAVVGSFAAEKAGLSLGSTFQPMHGVTPSENSHSHSDVYTVVGILEPTNSPSDRVIWIPIEGIYRMEGHKLRNEEGKSIEAKAGEEIPEEHKEVSSVMLNFRTPQAGMQLNQMINNQGNVATLAWPISRVMGELFDKMGWVNKVLELVAYLVVVVASGSILATIYNTIHERRREFAIMRALGAEKSTVFSVIIGEAGTLAAIGSIVGFVIYYGIFVGAAQIVKAQTGIVLDPFLPHEVFIIAPVAITALGILSGILPALKAYSTDVATNISPSV